MSIFVQWLIGIAAALAAFGVIWRGLLQPMLQFFRTAEEMLPLLRSLTTEFKGAPDAFKVLAEIADQFSTSEGGSSLKDQVIKLELAAMQHQAGIDALKVSVESIKEMAKQNRNQQVEQTVKLDRLDVKVDSVAAATPKVDESSSKE